jgi:acyl-CoA synthetase (AMP-forming)/AMP-acid ligase II
MSEDRSTVSSWEQNNVAARLPAMAARIPEQIALASPLGSAKLATKRPYKTVTFTELELITSSIAAGLQQMGVKPGMRIVLLVRFGADFIALVFALLKIGAVIVLVDPGMGRKNILRCLQATNPDGFIAIPIAHCIRRMFASRFPRAKLNVTVGLTFGVLPKPTLKQLLGTPPSSFEPPPTTQDSEAAIIFTTGSTGPPKGVLYTHRTFNSQVDAIAQHYGIRPGGKDLSGFPLFGLFNAVMGTTTVIPDMDPTRPADVDPPRLLDAIDQWKINQAFGSPALWTAVGRYAADHKRKVPSLKLVLSAGAPVPARVLESMRQLLPADAQMHTPYGATESLPIASIESNEILTELAVKTQQGAGTCVGRKFDGIQWQVIEIQDGPLTTIDQVQPLPPGQIGELMVCGDVVTHQYVTRTDQNDLHKVQDGQRIWHRMGDVGYLDQEGRFWFCGRKSHRVRTDRGNLYTEPCEAIFNQHPHIHRSALVGIGSSHDQTPVVIVETWPEFRPKHSVARDHLIAQLRAVGAKHPLTAHIEHILIYPGRLPTDIRHNSKIFREQLAPWAAKQLGHQETSQSPRR